MVVLADRTTDWRRYQTRAWSTQMTLLVDRPAGIVEAAAILHRELDRMDGLANRFRPDSELSALGEQTGHVARVSPDLLELLVAAIGIAQLTGGAVDPTVGAALCRLGYDRDFAQVASGVPGTMPARAPVPGWQSVTINRAAGTVHVPLGTSLDLGATAKAIAADRIARAVHEQLACAVLVSLGGDIALAGPVPAEGIAVGVADGCAAPRPSTVVSLAEGALATSGTTVRRWRLGNRCVHHVIDPSTGWPVRSCWRTATVAAATCLEANAASTAAIVKGEGAPAWLAGLGVAARLVSVDGTVWRTGGWPADGFSHRREGAA